MDLRPDAAPPSRRDEPGREGGVPQFSGLDQAAFSELVESDFGNSSLTSTRRTCQRPRPVSTSITNARQNAAMAPSVAIVPNWLKA